MSELYRALFMKPHPVPSAKKKGVEKGIPRARTNALTVFGNVMQGKGHLSLVQIVKLFRGKKTRCAVYNCLRNTLEPKGVVEVGYESHKGDVKRITYKWIGG